jgi:hypothetical protein
MATSTESARLRVVGQELEQKKVSDFEVFVEAGGYRLRAPLPPAPPPVVAPPKRKFTDLFKARPNVAAVEPNPEPEEWEHTYSEADIEQLDELYRARYALSHVLRVVGAYVEDRRWTLSGVSRKRQKIEIRHHDAAGELRTSTQQYAELYDFAMHMSRARGRGDAHSHAP